MIDHLFRGLAGKNVSSLVRQLGSQHLELAEDAVQESMLRALQLWPFHGVPERPEAWLYRVAHNHAISALRRTKHLAHESESILANLEAASRQVDVEHGFRDDELRMIFICCHPDLNEDARITLSLKLVGGFSVGEIGRLLLVPEVTIAQRLVRAKRVFRERSLTSHSQTGASLDSVLDTVYLMFSAGYSAVSGEELIRTDVCNEALRLGRLIADSSVSTPRADALFALMALQAARSSARLSSLAELVLLEDQDRNVWDHDLIKLGFLYFDRSLAGADVSAWHVQAAIAVTYSKAESFDAIDWTAILDEYNLLLRITGSSVVALNRAVVVGKVHGAAAALLELDDIADEAALRNYYLLPAIRGHMLAQLNKYNEAESAFAIAAQCVCSEPEKRFLAAQQELMQRRIFL